MSSAVPLTVAQASQKTGYLLNVMETLFALGLAVAVAMLVGLRLAGPGLDTENYNHLFRFPPTLSDGVRRFEPLFLILIKSLRVLFSSPQAIFACIAFLAVFLKLRAVSSVRANVLVFAAMYGAICLPFLEYNQIRVAIALPFVYFAIPHIETDRRRALFYFGVAIGFHYSMVMFALPGLIAMVPRRSKAGMAVVLLAVLGLAALVASGALMKLFESYAAGLAARAAEIDARKVNKFGFVSLLFMASIPFFFLLKFEGRRYIILTSLIGLTTFLLMAKYEIPYSSRILETVSAILPFAYARTWQLGVFGRIGSGVLVLVTLAYGPVLWVRLA